jgi:ABC-type transport system involved in multi-copper enzyme maturation permease subunit
MSAIGVKELRGRMRGRRAFVILTVYLILLAGFAWMMALILERQYAAALGGSAAFASAQIGRGVFGALLILETVLVVALAPAFTAGAISLEREKQTLDMLAATPISSLALILGKLISALTYVFILIVASIPLTAIVFVFGGVARRRGARLRRPRRDGARPRPDRAVLSPRPPHAGGHHHRTAVLAVTADVLRRTSGTR